MLTWHRKIWCKITNFSLLSIYQSSKFNICECQHATTTISLNRQRKSAAQQRKVISEWQIFCNLHINKNKNTRIFYCYWKTHKIIIITSLDIHHQSTMIVVMDCLSHGNKFSHRFFLFSLAPFNIFPFFFHSIFSSFSHLYKTAFFFSISFSLFILNFVVACRRIFFLSYAIIIIPILTLIHGVLQSLMPILRNNDWNIKKGE